MKNSAAEFAEAAIWFVLITDIERQTCRELVLLAMARVKCPFDVAFVLVHKAYLDAKAQQSDLANMPVDTKLN